MLGWLVVYRERPRIAGGRNRLKAQAMKGTSAYSDEELLWHIRPEHTSVSYEREAAIKKWPRVRTIQSRFGGWPAAKIARASLPVPIGEARELVALQEAPGKSVTAFMVKIPDCGFCELIVLPRGATRLDVLDYLTRQGTLEIAPVYVGAFAVECETGECK